MSHKEIRTIFEDFEKKRASAAQALRDKLITEDGYRHELDSWNRQQRWTDRMSDYVDGARSRHEAAYAKVDQLRADFTKPPAGDANEQLLFELRAQRQWGRIRPILDTLDHGKALAYAHQQVRDAEGHDAVVLAQELGAYLEAKGYITDALDAEFDAKIPGLAEAKAELEQTNADYLNAASAANVVGQYMAGNVGRDYVEICCPADPTTGE